ncbi:MAG: rod-binding protein [Magnetococcales bacterium]|nr:rod-binding protein [Magnetococcales bacterium]
MSDVPAIGTGVPAVVPSAQEQKRLQGVAADFEAIFIKQMLGSMRNTIPKAREGERTLVKESEGEKIFRDLLDGEYARVMSQRKNGLGLKEGLLKYLAHQPGQTKGNPQAEVARLQSQSNALNALTQKPLKTGLGGD